MLIRMGERPAILSRGYARTAPLDGVVVVSDGTQVHADVEHSGDEPLMLARMVPQASVLVASSRYTAGRLAESKLGCTIHVLDDGFQHFDLMRDIDLLVAPESLDDVRTLPAGRFREPLDAAAAADAWLVEVGAPDAGAEVVRRLSGLVPTSFTFSRQLAGSAPDRPAFAFAGIARPERFFRDLERSGWQLTGRRSFADHHPYSEEDVRSLIREAQASGAHVLLTTEKDAVRLGTSAVDLTPPVTAVPQETRIEPAFEAWLAERLRGIRAA